MMRLNWNKLDREERMQAIRDGVARKLSTTQIAAEMDNCTRNAVIGLAHRTKIPLADQHGPQAPRKPYKPRAPKPKKEPVIRPRKPATKKRPRHQRLAPVSPEQVRAAAVKREARIRDLAAAELPDENFQVHLLEVCSGQCRFPQWGDERRQPIENYMVCGRPVKPTTPYCPKHHERTFGGYVDELNGDRKHGHKQVGRKLLT
jgi:hypothetical protein